MKGPRARRLFPLLSFLIPVLCLGLYFIRKGIAPFRDGSFLIHDMNAQYVDFFACLRSVLRGENDLRYSLSRGLGGPFPAFFAYYLICPLNLIPALLPDTLVPAGISLEMLLLFGLAGLACFCCLRRLAAEASPWLLLYLSAAYSLSAWMLLNAENFQFIQEAAVLPCLIAALEPLRSRRDAGGTGGLKALLPAVLWLAAAMILNFYIGAMVWLFAALWLLVPDGRRPRPAGLILLFLAAGLLCLPVWIPVLREIGRTVKGTDPLWYRPGLNFALPGLLRKFLPGQFSTAEYRDAGLPAVYCGLPVPVLALFYFCRGADGSRRRHRLALALILVLSLIFRPLTMVWHGFSEPHWWPYRFSFLLIFVLVLSAAESRVRIPLLILALCMAGPLFNLDRTLSVKLADALTVTEYTAAVREKQERLAALPDPEGEFYRVEDLAPRTENDALRFGYSGISSFDSLADRRVTDLLAALGFPRDRYSLRYGLGNTAFANTLLGVRYVTGPDGPVAEFPAAGIAFRLGEDLPSELPAAENAVAFQNALALALGMETPPLTWIEPAEVLWENLECGPDFCWKPSASGPGIARFRFEIPRDGILYACPGRRMEIGGMTLRADGKELPLSAPDAFLPLGAVSAGGTLTVTLETEDPLTDLPDLTFILEDRDAVGFFFARRSAGIRTERRGTSDLAITLPPSDTPAHLAVILPCHDRRAEGKAGRLTVKPLWDTLMAVEVPAGTAEIRIGN